MPRERRTLGSDLEWVPSARRESMWTPSVGPYHFAPLSDVPYETPNTGKAQAAESGQLLGLGKAQLPF